MVWDGVERRKESRYCDSHIQLFSDMQVIKNTVLNLDKRINGSMDSIKTHIEQGSKWRMTIATVGIGLILSIMGAVYAYGRVCERVDMLHNKVFAEQKK